MRIQITHAHPHALLSLTAKTVLAFVMTLLAIISIGLLQGELFWLACCMLITVTTVVISILSFFLISRYPKLLESLSNFTSF
jgi:hypothetical protein